MILFILYEFVSNTKKGASGGNISNYLLIETLRQNKKIGLIAPNISEDLRDELEKKGVLVISETLKFNTIFKRFKKRQWLKNAIQDLAINCPELLSEIEIVVSSNGTCDLVESLRGNKRRLYILCRAFEDFFNKNSHYPLKEKLKRVFIKLFDKKKISDAYRTADKIITNSEYMKGFIEGHYPKTEISILYPPIDIPIENYKSIPIRPRIGIINPSAQKGENIFLSLANHFPSFDFVYFSQHKRNYLLKNIKYSGWLSDRKKLFSSIDVLIVPSVWSEPFGRVSVEAIRSGVPVLVSNVGGLPETVDSKFIVPGPTIQSWKKQLDWLIANEDEVELAWNRSISLSFKFEQKSHTEQALNIFTQ